MQFLVLFLRHLYLNCDSKKKIEKIVQDMIKLYSYLKKDYNPCFRLDDRSVHRHHRYNQFF